MSISLLYKDTKAAQGTLGTKSSGPFSFTIHTAKHTGLAGFQGYLSQLQPPRGRPCGLRLVEQKL